MELNDLLVFYKAAQAQSFSHSGINLSPSAIGRKISKLERELRITLFHRYQRGVALTDEGLMFYERVKRIIAELEASKDDFSHGDELRGRITIFTPYTWSAQLLTPYLKGFLEENPRVSIEVNGSDTIPSLDPVTPQAAIYPFVPDAKDIAYRYLGGYYLRLYASKEYVAEHGQPKTLKELDDHRIISYSLTIHTFRKFLWHLDVGMKSGETREAFLKINDVVPPLVAGMGIATIMDIHPAIKQHNLVHILPELKGPKIELYFLNHKFHNATKIVQALSNFVKDKSLYN